VQLKVVKKGFYAAKKQVLVIFCHVAH